MIEPGVRYLPHPGPAALSLEAVDLSKKSSPGFPHHGAREEEEGSDSDTPLDMSVTATARLSPVLFPGFRHQSPSPARSDRSESSLLVRLPGLYSPGSLPRDWSAERSEPDRDELLARDGCHICGMPRGDMAQYEHGEGVCNQRPIACPLCAKTFTLWSHYETHKKCHQKLKQRQYPCQSCGKIFTSASNRNMHQRIHKGVRPFQCIPCGVFFRQKAHLQKHQRTQGHIQATELYEKRKAEGLVGGEEGKKEESLSSGSSPRSEDSRQGVDSSPGPEEEGRGEGSSAGTSPQRKVSGLQYSPGAVEEEGISLTRDQQINANIEYNNMTHGYECRQCDFGTHDHAMMKEHVATDHLREKADLQCKECMVTFTKPFNLKIHIRKHETSSQFLPCEYCEQVFKVPNKLIKHMEGVHSVCPTCGEKNMDKAGLLEHLEGAHGEPRRSSSSLGHLGGLAKPRGVSPHNEMDNRHAKMRKLDSLADHIRAKQLQAATVGTNHINGNTDKPGLGMMQRRKSEMPGMPGGRQEPNTFFRPGLEHLVTQLNKMHDRCVAVGQPMIKSENNNILSSLSKMSEFPHQWRPHSLDRATPPHHLRPAELTPPVSPPPTERASSGPLLINNNHEPSDAEREDCSEDKGLDLTVKKEPKMEEPEAVVRRATSEREEVYRRGGPPGGPHILPHSFPYMVPNLPFLARMPIAPIPHHNASFTEHLFKLASISRPPSMPPPSAPQDLSKPAGHPAVLSAMLHHRPPAQGPVFPGFPPGLQPLPPSMFPQHPLPPGAREHDRPLSPPHSKSNSQHHPPHPLAVAAPPGLDSKPFRCTYCPKEFGHLSSLESHVERLHTNESKHHCEHCGKAFSSKSNLTAHKKIHSGERPFECAVCQKRFRQKAHLQKHETTHSSATPYQCPHCDKAFGHPSNLNTHIATHSDVRPYECSECGKAYKDAASFKRHRLVHTGERPHPCDLCPEQFIDSKSLRRHREVAHPTALPAPDTEEEEEEFIDPGQEEEEYRRIAEEDGEEEGVVGEESGEEGDLEIAEVSADSGLDKSLNSSLVINSSLTSNTSLDLTV